MEVNKHEVIYVYQLSSGMAAEFQGYVQTFAKHKYLEKIWMRISIA